MDPPALHRISSAAHRHLGSELCTVLSFASSSLASTAMVLTRIVAVFLSALVLPWLPPSFRGHSTARVTGTTPQGRTRTKSWVLHGSPKVTFCNNNYRDNTTYDFTMEVMEVSQHTLPPGTTMPFDGLGLASSKPSSGPMNRAVLSTHSCPGPSRGEVGDFTSKEVVTDFASPEGVSGRSCGRHTCRSRVPSSACFGPPK